MIKKKYIFTETGERRLVRQGEYYLNCDKTIIENAVRDLGIKRWILKLEVEEIKTKRKVVKG